MLEKEKGEPAPFVRNIRRTFQAKGACPPFSDKHEKPAKRKTCA